MTLENIVDEQKRWKGFRVNDSKEYQTDVIEHSYLYLRNKMKGKFGIEDKNFYKLNKEALLHKILKRYNLYP